MKTRQFTFEEKQKLVTCREIASELNNPAIDNMPIYVVDSNGGHHRIEEIGFGENFEIEIRID